MSELDQFSDVRWRFVVTGMLSRIPGLFDWWDRRRPMGNTASAAYCRGIWQFHRDNAVRISGVTPRHVGELGPGATLGTCIAALLDGAETAVAFDAGTYASVEDNLRMLRELSEGSPDDELRLAVETAAARAGGALRYVAPWSDPDICAADSLDLIFSHSVMEHVADPAATYVACHRWLKPGGVVSHKVDHSSHGITRAWNGHYSLSDALWSAIFGKRPYLLNRMRPRQHIDALRAAGLELLPESRFVLHRDAVQEISLREFPDDDRHVRTSTLLARKPR